MFVEINILNKDFISQFFFHITEVSFSNCDPLSSNSHQQLELFKDNLHKTGFKV